MGNINFAIPPQKISGEGKTKTVIDTNEPETTITQINNPINFSSEPKEWLNPYSIYADLVNLASGENKDSILFAYYIYTNNYYWFDKSANGTSIRSAVHFCNRSKWREDTFDECNKSLLERMEVAYNFPKASTFNLFGDRDKNEWHCGICGFRDNKMSDKPCSYEILFKIILVSKELNKSVEDIFRNLLSDIDTVKFNNKESECFAIPYENPEFQERIKGIDSKSALAAYLLLRDGLIEAKVEYENVYYDSLRLCNIKDKESKIDDFLSFWRSEHNYSRKLDVNTHFEKIYESTCSACNYKQCPERLAAYFSFIAAMFSCKAVDIALFVAKNNTFCKQSLKDNHQYNTYVEKIIKSTLSDEDKEELVSTVNYIISKKENRKCPVIPLNMAFYSKDFSSTKDFIWNTLLQALWYSNFFGGNSDDYNIYTVDLNEKEEKDIIKLFSEKPTGTMLILTNFSGVSLKNVNALIEAIVANENRLVTILIDEKKILDMFFEEHPNLQRKIFSRIYTYNDLSASSVTDRIETEIEKSLVISDEKRTKLARYIDGTYLRSGKESSIYIKDTYRQIMFNHFSESLNVTEFLEDEDIPALTPRRTTEEIFKELDELIGLKDVKSQLRQIASLVQFEIKRNRIGTGHQSMHMVFTGNPGTGKTTVARLAAEILHSIGFIQENKLVQCSASDLIGEYLGQTSPKTARKCEEAYNGVLFIDEAYQLNPYTSIHTDMYKEECIAELIQQMENNRDRLVVIFAGYTKEMEEFIKKANTGLSSRLQEVIEFPDYSVDELMEIFLNIVKKNQMEVNDEAKLKLRYIFSEAVRDPSKRFGNARYARNIFDKSYRIHAVNCCNLEHTEENEQIIKTLTANEIVAC